MSHGGCIVTSDAMKTDDTVCNLNGNWTSSPVASPPTHIEFFQEEGSSHFTIRATAWGTTVS